jgi:hypothetical protein
MAVKHSCSVQIDIIQRPIYLSQIIEYIPTNRGNGYAEKRTLIVVRQIRSGRETFCFRLRQMFITDKYARR